VLHTLSPAAIFQPVQSPSLRLPENTCMAQIVIQPFLNITLTQGDTMAMHAGAHA
jgi:hypothetical protein